MEVIKTRLPNFGPKRGSDMWIIRESFSFSVSKIILSNDVFCIFLAAGLEIKINLIFPLFCKEFL